MLNLKSINKVNQSNFNDQFKRPSESYCFSRIPNTIMNLFGDHLDGLPNDVIGNERHPFQKVVIFLLDGFGYNFLEKYYQKSTFLKKALDKGVVSKLTTQFPSTTTANITTMNSGLPVSQTGIYEWFIYEPKIDAVYCPLLYKYARTEQKVRIAGEKILPRKSFYSKLKKKQIKSYIYQYELFNIGTYSQTMSKDATKVNISSLSDGLEKLKIALSDDEKAYYYFYLPEIDSVSHEFGPHSKELEEEILNTFKIFDAFFADLEGVHNTAFLMTADHGQTSVIKEKAYYLNKELPELIPLLKSNKKGELIVPCGSFRDMFLHIKRGKVLKALKLIRTSLKGIAEVYRVKDIAKVGLFGKRPSRRLLKRLGDLVILPYKDQSVWYFEDKLFYVKHLGMHGGLVSEEIEIPFIYYPIKK